MAVNVLRLYKFPYYQCLSRSVTSDSHFKYVSYLIYSVLIYFNVFLCSHFVLPFSQFSEQFQCGKFLLRLGSISGVSNNFLVNCLFHQFLFLLLFEKFYCVECFLIKLIFQSCLKYFFYLVVIFFIPSSISVVSFAPQMGDLRIALIDLLFVMLYLSCISLFSLKGVHCNPYYTCACMAPTIKILAPVPMGKPL